MQVNFKPLNDFLLIKQGEKSDKIGSIIVSTVSNRPLQSGEVLAVGPKCRDVDVGNRVQFELGEFQKVLIDGCELLLVKESKVIGVYEDE